MALKQSSFCGILELTRWNQLTNLVTDTHNLKSCEMLPNSATSPNSAKFHQITSCRAPDLTPTYQSWYDIEPRQKVDKCRRWISRRKLYLNSHTIDLEIIVNLSFERTTDSAKTYLNLLKPT